MLAHLSNNRLPGMKGNSRAKFISRKANPLFWFCFVFFPFSIMNVEWLDF